jgi:hypothetical protein
MRPTTGLAVDGDESQGGRGIRVVFCRQGVLNPALKAGLESLRLECDEDASDAIA